MHLFPFFVDCIHLRLDGKENEKRLFLLYEVNEKEILMQMKTGRWIYSYEKIMGM